MSPATDLSPAAEDDTLLDTTDSPGPFVVTHTLTTLTGVSLNRDMDQMPKAILFGDVERMRVSSQALARAARERIRAHTINAEQAASTKTLPLKTADILRQRGIDSADADPAAALIVSAAGVSIDEKRPSRTRAMTYVPATTPDRLATILLSSWDALKEARTAMETTLAAAHARPANRKTASGDDPEGPPKPGSKGAKSKKPDPTKLVPPAVAKAAAEAFAPGLNQELALFGRMLTELPDGDIRSAVAVAHGFSVDRRELLADSFTAVDDWQDGGVVSGAGMLGEQFLTSGTLYRYAALDRRALRRNLQNHMSLSTEELEETAREAERTFITAISYALPRAMNSRTGSAAWPTLAIAATCDQPLTAAAAFETAVQPPAGVEAATRLARYLQRAKLRGGIARWMSPTGEAAPPLPDSLLVES